MQMREAAERLLFSSSMEEKLALAPEEVSDDTPGTAISLPDVPGRPDELRMVSKGAKSQFPGVNQLDDDAERGKMLHFLANHELLAAELMALVLLKFPDAPKEYRAGVYEAMREEQMHTMMYLRRMKECGIHFGELPLNDYFWKLIAPMETPMDFVTRLNLTFEQANLDFSKYYSGLFRQVGDTGTAAVLEKIYQDEIGHVGHGVKWFRKWKAEGETDWQAYKTSLTFPLAPAKAKGIAPFNAEGRRRAGLDEDFISHLEVCEQSRGRTPVLHWFNPSAESHAMPFAYTPNKSECALMEDLEMLILAWSRKDDIALLRKPPGKEHLARLKKAGFDLPEIVAVDDASACEALAERKLGGLRPWAWSPDAAKMLLPYAKKVSKPSIWQWCGETPAVYFSKEIGTRLEQKLGLTEGTGVFCYDLDEAMAELKAKLKHGDVLLKAAYACAGRGHRRISQDSSPEEARPWIEKTLKQHGGLMVEPWLERVLDFSSLYEIGMTEALANEPPKPVAKWIGMTRIENDARGKFLGTIVHPKWGSDLDTDLREFLFREREVVKFYRQKLPDILPEILPGYRGAVGVDAMVFLAPDGGYGLRYVVELNVRMTMGRVALELHKKLPTPAVSGRVGRFRILRKNKLSEDELLTLKNGDIHNGSIVINNPNRAISFLATWGFTD